MIGALAAGKKAAEYGYKVYGVPGAVVAGAGGAAGIVVAKKGVEAVVEADDPTAVEEETTIEIDADPDADDGAATGGM